MWNPSHPFFWYKALFTVQLLFPETLFTMNFEKKRHFWLRISCSFILCVLLSFAFPTIYNAAYSVLVFTAMFAFSILALKFSYDESFKNVPQLSAIPFNISRPKLSNFLALLSHSKAVFLRIFTEAALRKLKL